MTSTRTLRPVAAFAAIATAGVLTVGCSTSSDMAASSGPGEVSGEPTFENTYPAFQPLNDDAELHVPNSADEGAPSGPEPTLPGTAADQPGGQPQQPDTQAQSVQGAQPGAGQHQTAQAAKMSTYNSLSGQLPQGEANGAAVNVHGTPATVCQMGDGYNIAFVMAGANTSCDFARSTAGRLMTLAPSSQDDLRAYIPAQVTVNSSVTQQNYSLTCNIDEHEVIRCTGGNSAEVLIV
ncbi:MULTISPECIES: hypothetical protein [Corynebacterium]|uniref:hypothetical protein n=1 Tax=Corynebacterium TaxID=1716 RepID=UPI000AC11EFE|nr:MULTISPECIES: hypothetical protein [Corynebacterium]WJY70349.1 hypothetical protein CAURIM_06130 [Corynebacterium aurimucosum]